MTKTDLSTEALLVRREISEKATPGPWGVKCERHDNTCHEYLILTEDGDKIVGADKIDPREVYYRSLPEAICSLDSHDAAHIAANSPDVVIATIDELLRLRAENGRLKEGLENALHVNELRLAEVAKTLFTGIVEGISGDSESVRVQTDATCVHCNACFTSAEDAIAHDKVCPKHPANIRAELLEKEAEWLANRLACIQSARDIEPQTRDQNPEWWREAARKAVEES